jgi:nitroimidazol reductase NimA-like FMN-containing flavoprotein (pyridoxamine 5'-phosphate oxidase superfamily)
MMGSLATEEIEAVLSKEVLGRIGCIADERPYIVPVAYVYDGEFDDVYIHSAEGMKLEAMRANPEVCFEVEQICDMANWRTVIARAHFEELWKDDEEERAIGLLASRLAPLDVSESANVPRREDAHRQHGITRPVLYRLHLIEKTGRYERT